MEFKTRCWILSTQAGWWVPPCILHHLWLWRSLQNVSTQSTTINKCVHMNQCGCWIFILLLPPCVRCLIYFYRLSYRNHPAVNMFSSWGDLFLDYTFFYDYFCKYSVVFSQMFTVELNGETLPSTPAYPDFNLKYVRVLQILFMLLLKH